MIVTDMPIIHTVYKRFLYTIKIAIEHEMLEWILLFFFGALQTYGVYKMTAGMCAIRIFLLFFRFAFAIGA